MRLYKYVLMNLEKTINVTLPVAAFNLEQLSF